MTTQESEGANTVYTTRVVTVEQLDSEGKVFRTFTFHRLSTDLHTCLRHIRNAYHLPHTRVSIDGVPVDWSVMA